MTPEELNKLNVKLSKPANRSLALIEEMGRLQKDLDFENSLMKPVLEVKFIPNGLDERLASAEHSLRLAETLYWHRKNVALHGECKDCDFYYEKIRAHFDKFEKKGQS
jgi:hypothetical protein